MTKLRCDVCDAVRMKLGGHPNSQLAGTDGLAAATMREVHRLRGRLTPDMLKDALPGYLKIEEDAAPEFWTEYADNIYNRLRATADAPDGPWRALPDTEDVPNPWWVNNRQTTTTHGPFDQHEAIAVRDALNLVHEKERTT